MGIFVLYKDSLADLFLKRMEGSKIGLKETNEKDVVILETREDGSLG